MWYHPKNQDIAKVCWQTRSIVVHLVVLVHESEHPAHRPSALPICPCRQPDDLDELEGSAACKE